MVAVYMLQHARIKVSFPQQIGSLNVLLKRDVFDMKAYRKWCAHLLYPLIQGISSGEGGCPSSTNYTGCAIGHVASGNVVTVQDHILIKLDEKGFD